MLPMHCNFKVSLRTVDCDPSRFPFACSPHVETSRVMNASQPLNSSPQSDKLHLFDHSAQLELPVLCATRGFDATAEGFTKLANRELQVICLGAPQAHLLAVELHTPTSQGFIP